MRTQTAFHNIVDMVLHLKPDQQEEIRNVLEKSLIEQRREVILQTHLETQQAMKKGKLKFSGDMKKLKAMLK